MPRGRVPVPRNCPCPSCPRPPQARDPVTCWPFPEGLRPAPCRSPCPTWGAQPGWAAPGKGSPAPSWGSLGCWRGVTAGGVLEAKRWQGAGRGGRSPHPVPPHDPARGVPPPQRRHLPRGRGARWAAAPARGCPSPRRSRGGGFGGCPPPPGWGPWGGCAAAGPPAAWPRAPSPPAAPHSGGSSARPRPPGPPHPPRPPPGCGVKASLSPGAPWGLAAGWHPSG